MDNSRESEDNGTSNSSNNEEEEGVEELEVSRNEMLANFLTDETLMDVVLQGNDGVKVPANRCVLSSRSRVFRQMLLGKFKEASEGVIKIGYTGKALRTLVEYICTDSAETFRVLEGKENDSNNADNEGNSMSDDLKDLMGTLVSVADAASYFQLPNLSKKVQGVVAAVGKQRPALSFTLLETCHQVGPSVPDQLYGTVLSYVRFQLAKNDVTDKDNIASLSPDTLESILRDQFVECGEYKLFQLVNIWVDGARDNQEEHKSRLQIARTRLVRHVRLEQIDPRCLTTDVAGSGFVDDAQLYEAYKQQALASTGFDKRLKVNEPRYQEWNQDVPPNVDAISAIKVLGAGLAFVNGVYHRDGEFSGVCKFRMQLENVDPTTQERRLREFWIMQCATRSTIIWWFISLVDEQQPGTDRDVDYYRVGRSENNPEVPPPTGWRIIDQGMDPPPQLFYKLRLPTIKG